MGLLSWIKKTAIDIDPFYEEIEKDQIASYQEYVKKLINLIDIENHTKWAQRKLYNKQQMNKDEQTMENIIVNQAAKEGLNPALLQVMLNQYFFADPYQRAMDKDNWAWRVIHRKDVDDFPDGLAMRNLLEKLT